MYIYLAKKDLSCLMLHRVLGALPVRHRHVIRVV